MNNMIKSAFEKMPLPSVEEVVRQAREEPVLFPDVGAVTEEWIRLSQSYLVLFGRWFLKETGLDRLDERVSAEGIRPASEEQKGFYQKYDRLGLRYFYLRCWARIERLEGEETELLKKYLEEEPGEESDRFLERTFAAVMAVCPDWNRVSPIPQKRTTSSRSPPLRTAPAATWCIISSTRCC